MIEYRHFRPSKTYAEIAELFYLTFPKSRHPIAMNAKSERYLKWLYNENPSGAPVGFEALSNEKIVGHYVCIPSQWEYGSTKYKALLSLNTAVHPDFQGKGVFSSLLRKSIEQAKLKGFDFIYGVANQNSTHGFHRCGFDAIGQLNIQIGLCGLEKTPPTHHAMEQLNCSHTPGKLEWRTRRPFTRYTKTLHSIVSQSENFPIKIRSAIFNRIQTNLPILKNKYFHPCVYIGTQKQSMMVPLPKWLRPTPMNLIFLPLSEKAKSIDPRMVSWNISFLDFDLA